MRKRIAPLSIKTEIGVYFNFWSALICKLAEMEFLVNSKNWLSDPNPHNNLKLFLNLLAETQRAVLHNGIIKPLSNTDCSVIKLKILFRILTCESSLFWKLTVNFGEGDFRKEKLIKVIWKLEMRKLKLLTQHGDHEYILVVTEAIHLLSTPKEGSKNIREKSD